MAGMSDIRKAIMARLSFAAGEKQEMAVGIRKGIDKNKGGQWITGTWDGGTWSAMVFSEPSEAYGIPEFPHISKLSINPKDKPGIAGMIVNYDRGWDIKPSTPELQKAYREIAQTVTSEAKKAAKQGWYSRTGKKAEMAVHAGTLAMAQANYNRAKRDLDEAQERLDAFLRVGQSEQRIAQAERGVALAEKRFKDAEKALQSLNARHGAKAKMSSGINASTPRRRLILQQLKAHLANAKADRNTEAERLASRYLQRILKPSSSSQDWMEAEDALSRIEDVLHGEYARAGAKAEFDNSQKIIDRYNELKSQPKAKVFDLWKSKIQRGRVSIGEQKISEWDKGSLISDIVRAEFGDRAVDAAFKSSRPGAKEEMGAKEDRKRAAGYKWQVRYTKQLGKTDFLGGPPQVIEDTVYFATEADARDWANTMLRKGWFKGYGSGPEKVLTAKVLMFSRPGAKSTHAADGFYGDTEADAVQHMAAQDKTCAECEAETVKEGDKWLMATDPAVGKKIGKLMDEGYPQKQAIAIALDMKRRGEI